MGETRISAERLIDASAEVVYHCIADYRAHHRPGGFLPDAFTDLRVERGGVGAGTAMTFNVSLAGRTRTMTAEVSEPEPGRVLVETGPRDRTVLTVEPQGSRALVRFDTTIEAGGIEGLMNRLFAPRLMRGLYADELERLERYAQQHAAVWEGPDHQHSSPVSQGA